MTICSRTQQNEMLTLFDITAKKALLRSTFLFAVVLLTVLMPSAPVPMETDAGQRPEIEVNIQEGTLSIYVSDMPLVDVLQLIADEVGFKLMIHGSHQSRITQDFANIPLEEGIRRLVGNRSVAIMYQIVAASNNRKELQDIKTVWVFDSAETIAAGPVSNTREDLLKAEAPNEPEKDKPPQPNAAGINEATTYPQFDKESDVGYWADTLINNADRSSREQAIIELQRIGSDAAVAAIATAFSDNDAQLRRHAVESLGRVDNMNAVQLLGQALIGDKDPSVRLSAVRFFADQNSEVSRAFLNTALTDKNEQVQALAKQALGNH
jgi:hypothetical protein